MTQVDTYPGLASFQDRNLDRLLFCGRNEERRTLLNLVVGESISVLYSRSGLGKTSLINATLLQELRERNYFPVVARLTDVKAGPRESIISAIETQACARNVGIRGAGPAASLWEYLVDLELHTAGGAWKLVLVIDQFEELFTRIRERDREAGTQVEQTFIDELSDIVRHRLPATLRERLTRELEELDHLSYELAIADGTAPADFDPAIDCCDRERRRHLVDLLYHATGPDVKVLLSLREDYLPELEALRQSVPTIFQKMMRLDALTLDGARDAIVRPAALEFPNKTAFTYEPEVVDSMLAFLQRRKIGNRWVDTGMVDPGQLQILCQHLDRRRRERGATIITRDDLGGDAGMQRILRRFYRDILRRVPAVRAGWGGQRWQPSRSNFLLFHFPRVAVRTLIQKGLITRTGYRDSLMGETIVDRYGVAHEDLWRMVDAKLIRAVTRLDSQFFELTHDSLIGPIRTAARARRYKAAGVWAAAAVCAWIVTIIPDLVQNYREWREQKKIVALAASVVAPEDKHTMLGSLAGANKLANEDEVRDRRIATLIEQGQRDFRNEPLAGVRLSNLNWLSPNLSGADLKRAQFEAVTLYDADLSGAQLPLATFRETRLWKCSLRQANAVAADFSGSMFADVDMSGLRGRECDFHLTMMYGVNLTGADLTGANFEGVDFSHVDMTNADVTNVRFNGTAWWEASGWSAAQWKSLLADYPPDAVRQSRHYTAMLESYDQAIERTQQAHEKALALNERAWYRAVRGAELPLALQDANDAVTHGMVLADDAVANILDTRAYVRLQMKQPAAAIPDLEKAVELLPDSGALVYHLALAYEAVDRGDDAEAQFRRARELKYVPSYERLLTPAKSRPRRVRPSRAES